VLAFALPVVAYGLIFHLLVAVGGGVLILAATFGWALEPSVANESDHAPANRSLVPSRTDG
jgi:cytochrome c oxidase subunit 1